MKAKTIPLTMIVTHESHISYNFETGEWESSLPIDQEAIDLIFPKWIQEAVKKEKQNGQPE